MAIFSSARRYLAIATQSAQGTPAAAPTAWLPVVKSQTKFKYDMKIQDEKVATGDYYILVDGIPVQPSATGTIVVPFKPTVINPLLAACCVAGGDLIPPVFLTVWVGGGVDEDVYSDVFFSGGQMVVGQQQVAQWTLNFMGMQKPTQHAVRTPVIPTYERAYRLKDLLPATVFADTTVTRIDSLTIKLVSGVTAYFGSRGDGTDGPSDLILEELGAGVDLVRAYQSAAAKADFLNSCGAPGVLDFKLSTTCGTAHSHEFAFPNALLITDDNDAPDNAPIDEMLSFTALRAATTSGSPMVSTIV